jgi:hypothetical protein
MREQGVRGILMYCADYRAAFIFNIAEQVIIEPTGTQMGRRS